MSPRDGDLISEAMKASYFIEEAHRRLASRSILQVAEVRLLWFLRDRTLLSRRDLESTLGLGQSTINRQVSSCISKGLVKATEDADSRTQQLSATPLGLDLLNQHTAQYRAAYEAALAHWNAREQTQFIEALMTYATQLATEASSPGRHTEDEASSTIPPQ